MTRSTSLEILAVAMEALAAKSVGLCLQARYAGLIRDPQQRAEKALAIQHEIMMNEVQRNLLMHVFAERRSMQ